MRSFESFLEKGEVRERTPNPGQAENLIKKAEKRLRYARNREITEENSDLVLEDCYEAIRETIDAFMANQGFKSYNHEATIVFAFEELELEYNTANQLNKLRKLRNDSKYRGEEIRRQEAEGSIEIAEKLIPELRERFYRDEE
ncbi:MAG: HEPN domain-containing protein [Candidatus Nanohaloarchaea archaeon]